MVELNRYSFRLVGVMIAVAMALGGAHTAAALHAGAAKVEITPPLGTPLNGYGDRLGRGCVSVHDPVWARTLYLDDGVTNFFLVNVDLCFINRELRDAVVELAPPEVPKERIILTATHTHSAQGAMIKGLIARAAISGRYMPEILSFTAGQIAESMRQALAASRRAVVGYGTADQEVLSVNRRVKGGPIDRQIGVIRVDDSDGQAIAIVTNFAAHPTSVPEQDHYAVSADYVGFYYDEMERLSSEGCVALFMNGAEGNQTCANPEGAAGWERTASIGRLLAVRAKSVANTIHCAEAELHVGYAEPMLPRSMLDFMVPKTTPLMTLEIGGLLLTFFPGEPCVEIGLELRRQARERGYDAQFSVGLANEYLLYFAPPEYYDSPHYETNMSVFGPRIDAWFYREFGRLMRRGESVPVEAAQMEAEEVPGGTLLHLSGTAYARGEARGRHFGEAIRSAYAKRIVEPVESGAMIPDTGMWTYAPSFLNVAPLALARLGMSARTPLANASRDLLDEIAGMAAGAGLPFDAVWMLHSDPVFAQQADPMALRYRAELCTMFAAYGLKAGADDLLIARNLDWDLDEEGVILEVRPDTGHRFVEVGFPWHVGTFSGMNDAGLVLCVERVEARGVPSVDAPLIELVLRDLLQHAETIAAVEKRFAELPGIQGYHVLAADSSTMKARVIQLGPERVSRSGVDGLLLGSLPEEETLDAAAKSRYTQVRESLAEERIVAVSEMQAVLADAGTDAEDPGNILNVKTRHAVVFEPKNLRVHIAFPSETGLGSFTTLSMGGGDS